MRFSLCFCGCAPLFLIVFVLCFFFVKRETSLDCSRRLVVKACALPDVAKAGAPCAFLVNPCNWRLVGRGGRTNVLVNKSAGPCLEKDSLTGRKRAHTAEPIPIKVRQIAAAVTTYLCSLQVSGPHSNSLSQIRGERNFEPLQLNACPVVEIVVCRILPIDGLIDCRFNYMLSQLLFSEVFIKNSYATNYFFCRSEKNVRQSEFV